MEAEVKLLHIIGKVGVGKSTFISRYLNKNEIFDIKLVYERFSFAPADLMDSLKYMQFYGAIDHIITNYIRNINDFLVIESSGLNKAINDAIRRYPRLTILISGDIDNKIYEERPYALKFNEFFSKKMKENAIKFDIEIKKNEFGKNGKRTPASKLSWFVAIPEEYKSAFS